MPFVFHCNKCGSILYEDPKPVLHDGTYRRETYLEKVIVKIGGKCPHCGRKLNALPIKIEVSIPELPQVVAEKGICIDS
jgi:hypothetical protein